MDKGRQEKIDRRKKEEAKLLSLAAGWVLRYALEQSGLSGRTVCYEENGKPYVHGQFSEEESFISLSHSGNWAAATAAKAAVGIDIQKIVKVRSSVERHFFSEREMEKWRCGEQTDEEFCRLWAVKESYMKMTGLGMSAGFKTMEAAEDGTVRSVNGEILAHYRLYPAPAGYVLAACTEREEDLPETVKIAGP